MWAYVNVLEIQLPINLSKEILCLREGRFGIGADRYRPKVTTMTKNGAAAMDGSTTREIRERERLKQSYIAPLKTVKEGRHANLSE